MFFEDACYSTTVLIRSEETTDPVVPACPGPALHYPDVLLPQLDGRSYQVGWKAIFVINNIDPIVRIQRYDLVISETGGQEKRSGFAGQLDLPIIFVVAISSTPKNIGVFTMANSLLLHLSA